MRIFTFIPLIRNGVFIAISKNNLLSARLTRVQEESRFSVSGQKVEHQLFLLTVTTLNQSFGFKSVKRLKDPESKQEAVHSMDPMQIQPVAAIQTDSSAMSHNQNNIVFCLLYSMACMLT